MKEKTVLQSIAVMAEQEPHKICIVEQDNVITYEQHWNAVQFYAQELIQNRIERGTRIAIVAEQTARFLTVVSAIHLAGAVVIPLEKNLPENRIKEIMQRLDCHWLVSTKKAFADEKTQVIDLSKINPLIHVQENFNIHICCPKEEELADILFTTGTTGTPKGIQITHRTNRAIAENVIDSTRLEYDDVELIPTPINHSLGLRRYYGAMYRGSSIGIVEGVVFADKFFEMIEKYKITAIALVPAMLSILLRFSAERLSGLDGKLRFIELGSAALSDDDKMKLCELLPSVRLYNTYGATESGCTCILDFNRYRDKKFCIGRLTINTKIHFVGEDGKEYQADQNNPGCLVFEGPMNMKGYWKEPELNASILKNGKIYTDDVGYCGEDGMIYLLGRKDDVINSGGNKIAPQEIENVAMEYGKIKECACVPVKDLLAGEIPKLFVVMKDGEICQKEEILTYLSKHLEFYKVPKALEVIDVLPRTFNGKIMRKKLKER